MRAIFATNDGDIAFWQTGLFLQNLAKQYGHNRGILSKPRLEWTALRDFNSLLQHADSGAKFIAENYKGLRESEGTVELVPRRATKKEMKSWRSQHRRRDAGQR